MTSLTKIYNAQVRIPPPKYRPKAKEGFAPSSLGGKCLRKVYYSFTKSPREKGFALKSARILALGNVIGDHLSEVFRKSGVLVDYHNPDGSTPVDFGKENKEFPIVAPALGINKGYIDGVFISEGSLFLGEFKSINDRGYSEDLKGKPKTDHLAQGVTYLHIFNKMLKDGKYVHVKALENFDHADGVVFFYYNKNSSTPKEFLVSDTSSTFKNIVERLLYIKGVGESGVLPPMTEDYCHSCEFEKRCRAEEMAPRHGGLLEIK